MKSVIVLLDRKKKRPECGKERKNILLIEIITMTTIKTITTIAVEIILIIIT